MVPQPYVFPQPHQLPVANPLPVPNQGIIPPQQCANMVHNIGNAHNTLAFDASPLDAAVEDKTREKILRGRYIDLGTLRIDSGDPARR